MRWIRRKASWIALAAVGGFLVWMVATAATLHTTRLPSAGTLFGRPVSMEHFQKALAAVTHEAILRYGDRFREEVPEDQLSERAWERLMLLAEARRLKIRVSDREVVEELRGLPLFQDKEGQFDLEGYRTLVQYTLSTTPRTFEEEIRESLMIRKLLQKAISTSPVTEEEILQAFRKERTSIRICALTVPEVQLARELFHALRQDPKQLERFAQAMQASLTTTGFFKKEDQVQELSLPAQTFAALFGAEPGQVDGPFRGTEGWLVARLEEKRVDEQAQPSEEDRKRLEKELASRKQLTAYLSWYQDLLNRAGRR